MTPEEKARQTIDRMLEECGWVIQGRDEMDIYAGLGVAIREFPLQGGDEADCQGAVVRRCSSKLHP